MKLLNKISILALTTIVIAGMYVSYNNSECSTCSVFPSQCAGYIACQNPQRNFCIEAERAEQRKISFYQDPSVSKEFDREYEVLKKRCREQNPSYIFQGEHHLPQQEMTDITM